MECELCGRSGQLVKAEVEGALLSVCMSCARLGQRKEISYDIPDRPKIRIDETQVRQDFAKIIRNTRMEAGLSIEKLAEKVTEKASVIDRVEKGMRPTNEVAKKLEKALKIKLFGQEEFEIETTKQTDFSQSMSDIAVIKTKKK
jgi:putative transcription factor